MCDINGLGIFEMDYKRKAYLFMCCSSLKLSTFGMIGAICNWKHLIPFDINFLYIGRKSDDFYRMTLVLWSEWSISSFLLITYHKFNDFCYLKIALVLPICQQFKYRL